MCNFDIRKYLHVEIISMLIGLLYLSIILYNTFIIYNSCVIDLVWKLNFDNSFKNCRIEKFEDIIIVKYSIKEKVIELLNFSINLQYSIPEELENTKVINTILERITFYTSNIIIVYLLFDYFTKILFIVGLFSIAIAVFFVIKEFFKEPRYKFNGNSNIVFLFKLGFLLIFTFYSFVLSPDFSESYISTYQSDSLYLKLKLKRELSLQTNLEEKFSTIVRKKVFEPKDRSEEKQQEFYAFILKKADEATGLNLDKRRIVDELEETRQKLIANILKRADGPTVFILNILKNQVQADELLNYIVNDNNLNYDQLKYNENYPTLEFVYDYLSKLVIAFLEFNLVPVIIFYLFYIFFRNEFQNLINKL